jgi:hypothetical protein
MCGKLQTLLDGDSPLASLPLVVSSRNRLSALYLWMVAVPKNIARFRALMRARASPVSTPQSPNIVEGFFSYYSLPPSGTQSSTHHVSSLPRTTKYTVNCEIKSGALCLVLRGSSYIKRLQALGVWALVLSTTRESKSQVYLSASQRRLLPV